MGYLLLVFDSEKTTTSFADPYTGSMGSVATGVRLVRRQLYTGFERPPGASGQIFDMCAGIPIEAAAVG